MKAHHRHKQRSSGRLSRSAAQTPHSDAPDAPPVIQVAPQFETFYHANYRATVGLAYALSGSRHIAEDIAQDAFLAAHKDWDRIGKFERPELWVRRVVSNISVSMFRTKVREAKAVARMRHEPQVSQLMPEDHEFWHAVRKLPKRQAQAIALHYLEDRPVSEIAEVLRCTEATVRVHLFKGRKAIAKRLHIEDLR